MLHPWHFLHFSRMGLQIGNGSDHHFMGNFARVLDKETNGFAGVDLDVTRCKPHGVVHSQFDCASNFSWVAWLTRRRRCFRHGRHVVPRHRSEEHTSELQSLMRISYAVFCLKKKKEASHNNKLECM